MAKLAKLVIKIRGDQVALVRYDRAQGGRSVGRGAVRMPLSRLRAGGVTAEERAKLNLPVDSPRLIGTG